MTTPGIVGSAEPPLSRIVFFVTWYDVGKSALEELDGIHKITNGFRGSREINTVAYDADKLTPEKMITALKTAGTYIGIAEQAVD